MTEVCMYCGEDIDKCSHDFWVTLDGEGDTCLRHRSHHLHRPFDPEPPDMTTRESDNDSLSRTDRKRKAFDTESGGSGGDDR